MKTFNLAPAIALWGLLGITSAGWTYKCGRHNFTLETVNEAVNAVTKRSFISTRAMGSGGSPGLKTKIPLRIDPQDTSTFYAILSIIEYAVLDVVVHVDGDENTGEFCKLENI
ncbi:BgTH12-04983 [Blumeria graminis f. sp. triticale]|uniref:BgtE-20076 n=3 Tax=Blumeria graminis TaxID=34373 RepID=A0A381L0A2_BLUGR|nr:BgTH12-04983 [Blumeria graminis f. sp. triticale]VDB87660.1 BgtE-20076 [Blumeria graminis f. sp. tritici]